jgi:16S rRNA (guanine527-N7)-methyltransferase
LLFHVKHRPRDLSALRSESKRLGVPITAPQAGRLLDFERLLRDRAIPMGLVAESDEPRLRERHVLDCLRAAATVGNAVSAYDLGSGAGLPGIAVAVAVPTLSVALIESRRRRVSFLELAVEELELANAQVIPLPVELVAGEADLCFARAFAPLRSAWACAVRILAPGGRMVYFAGSEPGRHEIPDDARLLEVRTSAVLESAGPLVIMARQ